MQTMKTQTTTWPMYRMPAKPNTITSVLTVRVFSERMRADSGCSASSTVASLPCPALGEAGAGLPSSAPSADLRLRPRRSAAVDATP